MPKFSRTHSSNTNGLGYDSMDKYGLNPVTNAVLPRVPDIPRMIIKDKLHTFQRNVIEIGTIVASNSDQNGTVATSLSELDPNAEFSAIFQYWRILQVNVRFIMTSGLPVHEIGSGVTSGSIGLLHTVIDYFDPSATTTLQAYLEYGTHMQSVGSQVRTYTPRAQTGVVNTSGALVNAGVSLNGQWMSTLSNNVRFLGLKWFWEASALTNVQYTVRVDAVVQFKNTK